MRYSDYLSDKPKSTPSREAAAQFTYELSHWDRLMRFLILGTEGGSYTVSERKLTLENCNAVLTCIAENAEAVVKAAVDVSVGGRAPKVDSQIFTLALVAAKADPKGKRAAYDAIAQVCRTGTHLFQFIQNVTDLRGWSRGLRRAVSNWYLKNDNVEYQLAKYQSRNGWSHRDVLRLAHPTPANQKQRDLFSLVVGKGLPTANTPIFQAMDLAKRAESAAQVAKIVQTSRLSREMIPTQYLKDHVVLDALMHSMPIGAMLRNLASMTSNGFLANNLQPQVKYVCDMLRNADVLKKGRIHPVAILNALQVYSAGRSEKGDNTWKPVQAIVDALNDAFYLAFQTVEATGKSFYIGVDVSPSMSGARIAGTGLTARDAAAALALVTASVEKNCEIRGFCHEMVDLGISPRQRFDDVLVKLQKHNWGSTNIAAPIDEAIKLGLKVDCFVIITDNDVNTGRPPVQALREYRRKTGINAKMIVLATCASDVSVADVNDAGMLDIAGFDTAVPQIINEFVK